MDYTLSQRPPPGAIHHLWNGTPLYALPSNRRARITVSAHAFTLSTTTRHMPTQSASSRRLPKLRSSLLTSAINPPRCWLVDRITPGLVSRLERSGNGRRCTSCRRGRRRGSHPPDGRRLLHSAIRRGTRPALDRTLSGFQQHLDADKLSPPRPSHLPAGRLGLQRWEVPCEWLPSPTSIFASLSVLPSTASNPSSRSVTPPHRPTAMATPTFAQLPSNQSLRNASALGFAIRPRGTRRIIARRRHAPVPELQGQRMPSLASASASASVVSMCANGSHRVQAGAPRCELACHYRSLPATRIPAYHSPPVMPMRASGTPAVRRSEESWLPLPQRGLHCGRWEMERW
ncbi:hypothetical protein C8F01DRAFT_1177504 [Mycena amicta]|nr:hypothetical protein C8F01DRAFT_1177504 [Mycena amicta]